MENRFDDVSEEIHEKTMSRADFNGTFPTIPTYEERKVDQDFINEISAPFTDAQDANMPYHATEFPTQGRQSGVKLRDLVGKDKDDPLWDTFMDQMTVEEMATLIGTGCYNTQAFEQYGIPHTAWRRSCGFVDF